MVSPYAGLSEENWLNKTQELVSAHPLTLEVIRETVIQCWQVLWQTTVGEGELAIRLYDLDVPAPVVGYFFERLFARDLEIKAPQLWRGGRGKDQKDIIYIPDNFYSIEIKTSGQLGLKIFGNRSYGQESNNPEFVKKEKSGYYITVNFYDKIINLIRFGWIEQSDWKPQSSQTGQAAGLKEEVYQYKLISIPGEYRLNAPITILPGVGKKSAPLFAEEGVRTLKDVQEYQGLNKKLLNLKSKLQELEPNS